MRLYKASAHKNANTRAGNIVVTRDLDLDLDLWPFEPKINELPVLIVEHFYVKFDNPSCTVFFWDIVRKKQTHRETEVKYPLVIMRKKALTAINTR